LQDHRWRHGLEELRGRRFRCSLEVFSPQLPNLLPVFEGNPEVGFTLAVMGWPADAEQETFRRWRSDLRRLSVCPNTRIIVSGLECIFGMNWVVQDAEPWLDAVFEIFGFERTMFGSSFPYRAPRDPIRVAIRQLFCAHRRLDSGEAKRRSSDKCLRMVLFKYQKQLNFLLIQT
jgi:predicted TIM-barrel fold metal-dependent hydrolase